MKGTTNGSAVDVAKDVVQYLNLKDDEEISFSIRYIFDGVHHVYGYIYKASQHHYGTIHVDMIGRISVTITVTADVYRTVWCSTPFSSFQTGHELVLDFILKRIDADPISFWHTRFDPSKTINIPYGIDENPDTWYNPLSVVASNVSLSVIGFLKGNPPAPV